MAEEFKKQLGVIQKQQLKIDEMKEVIVRDFIKRNKGLKSVLSYVDEIANLEELINTTKEAFYHTLTEPIKATLLGLARVTKLIATPYGTVVGDIPLSLTKELKMISVIGPIYNLLIEPYVYIGIHDDNCTKFAITGSNALQFALDNFMVDCSERKAHLEKQKQYVINEREGRVKNYNDRISKIDENLLILEKHKASE